MTTSTDTDFTSRFTGLEVSSFVANMKNLSNFAPAESPINLGMRSEEHTSELQSQLSPDIVCRLLLEIGRASCRERV